MRDFNHQTGRVDGPKRAILTTPRFAKAEGDHRIYRLQNSTKRYITHPRVFRNHSWR